MNKKSFIYLAASLLVFVSCKGKLDDISGDVFDYPLEMTFYASNEAHARTLLNDESILWESSDRIKVLWGENQYNVAASKPYNSGLNAEFKQQ